MLTLSYHSLYTDGIDPEARFPRERYQMLEKRLSQEPLVKLRQSRQVTREELLKAHAADYIDRFLAKKLTDKEIRQIGLRPWTSDTVSRTLHIIGGSMQAMQHVLEFGGFSGNMAGGTHHAHCDYGSGYCIFNDIAVCALNALQYSQINRILVLDYDVHQGDGTAAILASNDQISTVSVHGKKNFPYRKQQSDLDIDLPSNIDDEVYLDAISLTLDQFNFDDFDLLLYQGGVDPLKEDKLGLLDISRRGLDKRNRMVFEKAHSANLPTVIFMGGGYADPISLSVDAFYDLFSAAAEFNS